MEISRLEISAPTDELRKLILENPDLPIVTLTDADVVADEGGYWYGCEHSFCIKELLQYKRKYDDYYTTIDDKYDLEEYLFDDLADEEEYADMPDEEFVNMVKQKVKEYDSLWTKCIVIYITV